MIDCTLLLQLLSKLYLDTAEALWNGNKLKGKEAITKFYEDLPTSEHKLESLDSQPVSGNYQILFLQYSPYITQWNRTSLQKNYRKMTNYTKELQENDNFMVIFL